uniref:NRF domain-containing protein n=1 Tax=Caenorhabditis tropicalis TaxID=1561998 RepID=A0A1I7UTZ2_9PELO
MFDHIPMFHVVFQLIFCALAFIFLLYDIALLMATYAYRNDQNIPFAYLIVMNVCGVLCKIAFITDFVTYLALPYYEYLAYRELLGREFTMLGTLTYFIPMCVSVLMTLNRFFIVLRPTDQRAFGQKRIFFYSFLILVGFCHSWMFLCILEHSMTFQILCFTLLLIPRLSYCPVNFLASTLVFLTACAPERHPVTKFTNINAIWVPTTLLVINVIMMLHLKAGRYDIYSRMRQKSSVISMSSSNSLAQSQLRREHMLMRQTVAITVGLSFYEDAYNGLPQWVRDLTFYFRLETICAINFFVYHLGSPSTRKMLMKYFRSGDLKRDLKLDAFGKLPSSGLFEIPLIFDGSYQECQRISGKKYETNYCYLVLVPGKNARCSRSASSVIRSATCMSSSCTPDDLPTLFNSVPLLPFTACQAFCSDFNVPKTPAFWAFTGFLGVMTVIVLGASVIDYLELKNDNLGLKMLLTFSLWENAGVISSVKEQKPGFIKCLDCIRFMSMLWVVTGHAFTFLVPPDTIRSMSHFMDHPLNHLILNAFFSVDAFFLLSGIVVSYLFFKTRLKIAQIKSPMTWILYYIHRVFIRASYYNFSRLVWSLAVSWVIIANHMGWGGTVTLCFLPYSSFPGPIDAFMSHPMWQPFGRLSYCAYIVHFMTLFWFLNVSDVSMHYYSTFQIFIYYAVPACILSYIFAFFWSSMFEIPFIKLEKMLIETFIMTKRHSEPEEEVGSTERLIRL